MGKQNMEAVLIRPNDQKQVYGETREFAACEPPYWAMMLASFLREKRHEVAILDAEALDLSPREQAEEVKKNRPSAVGILVTGTNLSASTWKMAGARATAQAIRDSGYAGKIFFWGLHPSALPEQTLQEEPTDFVIKGEGFQTVHLLLEAVRTGGNVESLSHLKGLYYMEDGEVKGNPQIDLASDVDALPMQAFDLVPMERYHAHNWQTFGDDKSRGYAVVATSLGCPFQCSFCAVSALFGKKIVRYRKPEKVVEEIDLLAKQYGIHYIKILDECFVLNRKHVEAICDLLIEKGNDLNIWAYARVDTVDEVLLDKLYRAGFRWLALGIESANQDVLQDVKKGHYSDQDTEHVIQMIHASGIHIVANFMFGLPEDTQESMERTLEFAKRVNCEWPNFYTTMAYPGSKLYRDCLEAKMPLPGSWLGYSQYSYECVPLPTKHISGKDVLAFRDHAFQMYFEDNERYFSMMESKFGQTVVQDIRAMLEKRLRRKILE